MAVETVSMPSLDTLFTVKTVEVVQQVVVAPEQLKATLCYLLEQVAKSPDAPTRADFDEYRKAVDARLGHLLDAKISAEAAAAASQEEVRALQDRVNMLDSQVAQLQHSHSTVSSQVEEVAASTGELADTLSQAQQQVTELHEVQREQEQSLAALEDKAVSPEALQQLASTVSSVAGDLEAARAEASERHEVYQKQASIHQQEAALQKLVDLQAADEIVTTRMAQVNVEGVAGAVTALSREVSRSSSTIQDLQASVQDMRARMSNKVEVSEFQAAVAEMPGSAAGAQDESAPGAKGSRQGSAELSSSSSSGALVARGGPDLRLLHERVGNKADAQDLSRALGDIAALKQALGPAYLTTQGATGAPQSLADHLDLCMERIRKLESAIGAQQVVSAIVARRSASIVGSASEDDAGTRMADRANLTVIMARLQAMEQKILGRDAVLAKLKTAIERPQSAQASEDRQISRMSRSFRTSKKQELAEPAGDAAPGSLEHLANTLEGHAEEVSLISQALEDKAPLLVVQDLQGDLAVMQSQVLQLTQAQARTSNDPQASMKAAADMCGDLTTPQQTALEDYATGLLARRAQESVISAVIQPLSGAMQAVQLVQPLPGLPATAAQGNSRIPASVKIITAFSVPGINAGTDVLTVAERGADPAAAAAAGMGHEDLPPYGQLVEHQRQLGTYMQQLAKEVAKLKKGRSSNGREDTDVSMISRKPLLGFTCTACDRPLPKVSSSAAPHINSLGVAATVQLEMIRAHGIDTSAATIAQARRAHSSVAGRIPEPQLSPAVDHPSRELGPQVGAGGYRKSPGYLPARPSSAMARSK